MRGVVIGHRESFLMDLTNRRVIYLKGFLFVMAGLIAGAAILVELPSVKIAVLLDERCGEKQERLGPPQRLNGG